jgi:hypothetical protein
MPPRVVQVPEQSSSKTSRALWEQAYQNLPREDKDILGKHEKDLAKATKNLVDEKLREYEISQWTVQVAGKSVKLRELGLNILNFIDSSQAYLQSVTSSEPHAALAWSCISLLLPVSLYFISRFDYNNTFHKQ